MPYVSPKEVACAREMDLLTYLRNYEPQELVHFSGDTYTTRTHDSLKISNGKWCWWSRGVGGDTPKYAALRGTLSTSVFVGDVPGSDKHFSFAVPKRAGPNPALCVFECAIDALSYLTILKMRGRDWRQANCLFLAGIYRPKEGGVIKFPLALGQYLKDNPQIEKVILCLDSDEPGRAAATPADFFFGRYEGQRSRRPPCPAIPPSSTSAA